MRAWVSLGRPGRRGVGPHFPDGPTGGVKERKTAAGSQFDSSVSV